MTRPDDPIRPAAVEPPAAAPAQPASPALKVRNERAVRLAAALRANLKRRKAPAAPRNDRH